MYVSGLLNDNVAQFNLSTAWDVSTAVIQGNLSIGGQEGSSRSMHVTSNGTMIFISGSGSDSIHKYTMTTPHSIDTASFTESSKTFSNLDPNISGISFNNNGTRALLTNFGDDMISELELSTPWSLSDIDVVDKITPLEVTTTMSAKYTQGNVYAVDLSGILYQFATGRF